jgi:hypothetical protein
VIHWDYKLKYEVGTLNPIVKFLADKPWEHRVAGLPFEPQQQLRGYDYLFGGSGLFRIEWMQHHFPYYNIQSLEVVQMPRMPANMKAYKEALSPQAGPASYPLLAREWQLTNTRYLLGAAGFLDVLNAELDPEQRRFQIVQRFDLQAKPGVEHVSRLEDLTAVNSNDGELALFEFTGALPRAKIYGQWETNSVASLQAFTTNGLDATDLDMFQIAGTNDYLTLKRLAAPAFDPRQTVLVDSALPAPASTNTEAGSVAYQSYETKRIVLTAQTTAPAVLLLNDQYDPLWRVTVDGQPAQLLRCNYMMRGVYLPVAGKHTVEFQFSLPNRPLYITLAGLVAGLGLCGWLAFAGRKRQTVTA